VIAHNTEQHCGFASALPPEESHIIFPGGVIYPTLGTAALSGISCASVKAEKITLGQELMVETHGAPGNRFIPTKPSDLRFHAV